MNSAEDELLNTAHSQNIAASRNELQRAALNAQQQQLQQQQTKHKQLKAPTIPPKAPTIPPKASNGNSHNKANKNRPAAADDKDTSYDYAYYDSGNENVHEKDYSEYGFITDFGRTGASHK